MTRRGTVRGNRIVLLVLAGSLLLGIAGLLIYRMGHEEAGSVRWMCYPEPDRTATCDFEIAEGGKAGELCFTMVLDCRATMNSARVCSGMVKPGEKVTVRVTRFEPPMAPDASCAPPRFLDRKTTSAE